jgi:hypothetical protein
MKNKAILLLLAFCCITVIPLIILLLEACNSGYHSSILNSLIDSMDS